MSRARAEVRKLQSMMKDLASMKAELLPDEKDKLRQEDMKNFDDFQRKKHELNLLLADIRTDVDRLVELRKKLGRDGRDTTTIRLQSDNHLRLKEALEVFNELKVQLEKDSKKTGRKKIDEKELADRSHLLFLLGEDIQSLTSQNSRVKPILQTDDEEAAQQRISRRKQKDEEARLRREKNKSSRRLRKGESAIEEDDFKDVQVVDERELAFEQKVQENMKEQDDMLTEIAAGLTELQELATEANKQLTIQKAMLDQVDDKLDSNMKSFKTANARLKNILDESGGTSRWCPILICVIVLVALVGYIFEEGGL